MQAVIKLSVGKAGIQPNPGFHLPNIKIVDASPPGMT